MSRGLCAYAITRDTAVPPDGTRLVTHDGLGLVVAEVDLAPFAELDADPAGWVREPAEDDPLVVLVRRHDTVVRALFADHPVLPLRFGTILRDREAAVRLLADHHEPATARLDRVTGHREWGVRARSAPPEPVATPREGLSGTEYLALRRRRLADAEHARRRGSGAAAALHEALTRLATDTVPRARRSPGLLLDAVYLVPIAAEAAFHAELDRSDVLVDVTGPWPPYSFARLEVAHA